LGFKTVCSALQMHARFLCWKCDRGTDAMTHVECYLDLCCSKVSNFDADRELCSKDKELLTLLMFLSQLQRHGGMAWGLWVGFRHGGR